MPSSWVTDERGDGLGKGVGFIDAHQQSGPPVVDHGRSAGHLRRYHRQSAESRLNEYPGHAFAIGCARKDEEVGTLEEGDHVVAEPSQLYTH